MTLPADILINTGGNKKILSSQQCNGLMASMYGERSGGGKRFGDSGVHVRKCDMFVSV